MNAFPENPNNELTTSENQPRGADIPVREREQSWGADTFVPADSTSARPASIAPLPQPAVSETDRDPAWDGFDIVRLLVVSIVALLVGVFVVLYLAHVTIFPHSSIGAIAQSPLVLVAGQALAYLFILAYMYVLVTRERRQPSFFSAIHWNWPRNVAPYLLGGAALSIALQALAHVLPMPKELPIDTLFRTPAEAWVLNIFGITLAPLMEELFFRGFLYPVLARAIGVTTSIFITAFAFALMHGSQLKFSWGPVLVIFLVGVVLTMVRAYKNSVGAGLVIHMAYNGTIAALMFVGTDGFRHLEKLNQ